MDANARSSHHAMVDEAFRQISSAHDRDLESRYQGDILDRIKRDAHHEFDRISREMKARFDLCDDDWLLRFHLRLSDGLELGSTYKFHVITSGSVAVMYQRNPNEKILVHVIPTDHRNNTERFDFDASKDSPEASADKVLYWLSRNELTN